MSNHEELVKALRHCVSDEKGVTKCAGCPYYPDITGCIDRLHTDAAAAIEDLEGFLSEAERDRDEYEERMRKEQERVLDLQARLEEAENSVERWKDMYLTKHEPKRGEWIIDGAYTYNLRELNGEAYEPVYRCSCCNRQTESYLRLDEPKMPEDADFPEYCPHCGAKMEVQE